MKTVADLDYTLSGFTDALHGALLTKNAASQAMS
jgi:hypothetical protein